MITIDDILELAIQSSIVFDTSSLIWLAIGKNLNNLFHDLLVVSRSIHLAEESFDKITQWAINDSVHGKMECIEVSRKILGLKNEIKPFNIITETSSKHDEVTEYLSNLNLDIDNEFFIETMGLISILSKQSKNILVISDNYTLNTVIEKLRDYYKIGIEYITSYEITLAYFSLCYMNRKELEYFQYKYLTVKLEKYALTKEIYDHVRLFLAKSLFPKLKEKDASSNNRKSQCEMILDTKKNFYIYDTFLCYNNQDRSYVDEIGEKLQKKGISSWNFRYDNIPGHYWEKQLIAKISTVKSVIIFIGLNGIGGVQDEEIDRFINRAKQEKVCVIPLILEESVNLREVCQKLSVFHSIKHYENPPNSIKKLLQAICSTNKSRIFAN